MGQSVYPVPSSGTTIYPLAEPFAIPPNVSLQQTITTTTTSLTYPAGVSAVFVVLISAGKDGAAGTSGAAGTIVSGWTNPKTSCTIGTAGGNTQYGGMIAFGGTSNSSAGGSGNSTPYLNTIGSFHAGGQYIGSGGGTGSAGANATLRGFTGGTGGSGGGQAGGGGGAGFNGNGTNGGNSGAGTTNYGGNGGNGGAGGGGGGAGGNSAGNGPGAGGTGGAGIAYIYY